MSYDTATDRYLLNTASSEGAYLDDVTFEELLDLYETLDGLMYSRGVKK